MRLITIPTVALAGLISIGMCRAQAVEPGQFYTPAYGSTERANLMNSVRTAMSSPNIRFHVRWLRVFRSKHSAIAVGVFDDVGMGIPVGTIFFEEMRREWRAQYLLATDGSSNCRTYAEISEGLIRSSRSIGAPDEIFPAGFFKQYQAAKLGRFDSCMGYKLWKVYK